MNRQEPMTLPRTPASEPGAGLEERLHDMLRSGDLVARRFATSNVRRVEHRGRALYVKQYLEQPDLDVTAEVIRRRTAREIGLFERMASSPPRHRRLGTLRLVYGDAPSGILATEEVPGRPLGKSILGPFRRRAGRECLEALYLTGKWLRWFQSLPVRPGDEIRIMDDDPADLVEYCDVRMRKIVALGYGWPDDGMRATISGQLRRLIERSGPEDLRHVWSHGDYGTQNVLWDGATITPLDFGTAHLDHALLDVTYLIHRLEMLRIYFPWRRWPLAAWKRAILRGYGRPDAVDSPMYRALMIRHLHCRLKTYVRRAPLGLKQRIHNAWTRQCVRARLLRLAGTA